MFSKLMTALSLRAVERQTRRELNQLTDRDLADIGITRWDIDAIARSARAEAARAGRQPQVVGLGEHAVIV